MTLFSLLQFHLYLCWMWFFLFQSTRKIFIICYFHSSSNVRFQSLAACFNQTQMSGSLFLLQPVPLEANNWLWINPNPPIHSFTHMTHTYFMWGETSLKVSRLGSMGVVCISVLSFLFIFLFNFHLISTCLYPLFLSLTLSLSLFRVLIGVLQFFWRHYKHHNSEHLPFSSLYIFLKEFPMVLFSWLKIEAFVHFLLRQATEYITYA